MNIRYRIAKLLLGWANKVDPTRRTHCSPTENYIFRRQWTAEPYGIKDGIVVPRGETIHLWGVPCQLLHDIRVLSTTIEACGDVEEFKRVWGLGYSINKSQV
jgi:hypothetical protein